MSSLVTDSTRVKGGVLLLRSIPDNLIFRHALSAFRDDGTIECHHIPLSHLLEPQAHLLDDLLVLSRPNRANGIVNDKTSRETQHPAEVTHVKSSGVDFGAQAAYEAREWQCNTAEIGDDGLDVPAVFVVVVGDFFAAVVAVGDEEVAAGKAEVFADHDCYDRGHEETISSEESGKDGGGSEDFPWDYCNFVSK